MKKTVAVLLEDLLDRVRVLEGRLDRLAPAPANRTASGFYGVIRPAESLMSATATTGHSVNARGVFKIESEQIFYFVSFVFPSLFSAGNT